MKALVTGGAGFIGSHIADRLIREGIETTIIDDLSTGFKKNINSKAVFYEASIVDKNKVEEIFARHKFDFVFHLAAQIDVRRSTQDPIFDANSNIIGSLNIIISSVEHKVKRIIYNSTGGAVYGQPQYIPADEAHPVEPLCQYGISKHTVEHYLHLYSINHNINYVALRFSNVYGPRQNPHGEAGVIAIFIDHFKNNKNPVLYGDGKPTRDYVYVDDVVEANILSMEKGKNQIINIGCGKETSVLQIFNIIKAEFKNDKIEPILKPLREGEINNISLNADKALKHLGWKYKIDITEGIRKTVEYFNTN